MAQRDRHPYPLVKCAKSGDTFAQKTPCAHSGTVTMTTKYDDEQIAEYEDLMAFTRTVHDRLRENGQPSELNASDLDFAAWKAQKSANPQFKKPVDLSAAFSKNRQAAHGALP